MGGGSDSRSTRKGKREGQERREATDSIHISAPWGL